MELSYLQERAFIRRLCLRTFGETTSVIILISSVIISNSNLDKYEIFNLADREGIEDFLIELFGSDYREHLEKSERLNHGIVGYLAEVFPDLAKNI